MPDMGSYMTGSLWGDLIFAFALAGTIMGLFITLERLSRRD